MKFGEEISMPTEAKREEPKKETKKIPETKLRLPKVAEDYARSYFNSGSHRDFLPSKVDVELWQLSTSDIPALKHNKILKRAIAKLLVEKAEQIKYSKRQHSPIQEEDISECFEDFFSPITKRDQYEKELKEKKIPFTEDIDVGAMIEIPSAAITADLIAKEVDFFSLGTNDLIQYTLAVDRVNEKVAYLYQPTHPTILRLIDNVVKLAHRKNIWVGACGEMSSDPLFVLILLGLGVDEFSVSPSSLLEIKKIIRGIRWDETEEIVSKLLKLSTSSQTRNFAQRRLSKKIKKILEEG